MQIDTGELRNTESEVEREQALADGLLPIPEHLNRAARRKLKGKKTAMVSLTSGGKLSKWAAKKRKERRDSVKKARRINRK